MEQVSNLLDSSKNEKNTRSGGWRRKTIDHRKLYSSEEREDFNTPVKTYDLLENFPYFLNTGANFQNKLGIFEEKEEISIPFPIESRLIEVVASSKDDLPPFLSYKLVCPEDVFGQSQILCNYEKIL